VPIYEFHCPACRRDSELLVRSTEWQGTPCPHCGATHLEKKWSVFASNATGDKEMPACSGTPSACCRCGGGAPHRH
jgi:putative FmdB family regulatory protein